MNSLVQEILNASMVFAGIELMTGPNARDALARVANTEVIGTDVGFSVTAGGAPQPSRRLILQRDRISLDISSARSAVSMEYPPRDFSLLSEVINCAIENTRFEGQHLTAHGYNLMLLLEPELTQPAAEYIGNHLFASRHFGRENWRLAGGLGTLYFIDGTRRWALNVEPRPRDDMQSNRLFMSVNLHVPGREMPDGLDTIETTFKDVLDGLEHFAGQLIDAGG